MKTIPMFVISSILLIGIAACDNNAKTSSNAPNSTDKMGQVATTDSTNQNAEDSSSKVRKDQLNSDIRAREQRNDATEGDMNRADSDLASEVRSKLEANIPKGALVVSAQNGAVVVGGTVETQNELDKIDPTARQIKGVKSVKVAARVTPAVPANKP